ncbi:MAG: 4Fe-4S binding protein [Methanospirillum sp.]|nr:4Fe-4S binding protein [Methanospirillum sp.]
MKAGVMALTVLKNLIKGPYTSRYPYAPAKVSPATRGYLDVTIEDCIFCGLCRMHCPADAIEVNKTERTWTINRFRCVICGCCVDYCPKKCLHCEQSYTVPGTEPVIAQYTGPVPEEKPVQPGESSA